MDDLCSFFNTFGFTPSIRGANNKPKLTQSQALSISDNPGLLWSSKVVYALNEKWMLFPQHSGNIQHNSQLFKNNCFDLIIYNKHI